MLCFIFLQDGAGKKYVFTPFANYIWDEATIATMNPQNPQPTYRGLGGSQVCERIN